MQSWRATDRRALQILSALEQPLLDYSTKTLQAKPAQKWVAIRGTNRDPKAIRASERFPFKAKVMIRKGNRYVKGFMTNMSNSGAFLETHLKMFDVSERVFVRVRPVGVGRVYEVVAEIIRFTERGGKPGYGIRFCWPHEKVLAA